MQVFNRLLALPLVADCSPIMVHHTPLGLEYTTHGCYVATPIFDLLFVSPPCVGAAAGCVPQAMRGVWTSC
jgi:hypothetical protein